MQIQFYIIVSIVIALTLIAGVLIVKFLPDITGAEGFSANQPMLILNYPSMFYCQDFWGIEKMGRILSMYFRKNNMNIQISSRELAGPRCFTDLWYFPYGTASDERHKIQLTTTDPIQGAVQIFRQVGKVRDYIR